MPLHVFLGFDCIVTDLSLHALGCRCVVGIEARVRNAGARRAALQVLLAERQGACLIVYWTGIYMYLDIFLL